MVHIKRCETASHGSGAGRALGPISCSYRRRVTPQRRSLVVPPDTTSTSSSVTRAADTTTRGKGQGKGKSRSAASVERRLLKGIAKRWEQQLQKEDNAEPEVRPLALHPAELAQQSTTRHRAKLLLQQPVGTATTQSSSHLTPG